MAGNLLARAIVDGDDTWRLFRPFELIWAGGSVGRAAAQIAYWWTRRREAGKARHVKRHADPIAGAPTSARWPERVEGHLSPAMRSDASVTDAMAVPEVALPAEPDLD